MGPNQDWVPTEKTRQEFLDWLDQGTNSDGQRYAEVRRRLELYFDRKNCLDARELANEALHRVERKLEENGANINMAPFQFCYEIAKSLFLEALLSGKRVPLYRQITNNGTNPTDAAGQSTAFHATETAPDRSRNIADCLQRCLDSLSSMERELVIEYYRGPRKGQTDRRAALASGLGVTASTLNVGASRIRDRLEASVQACQNKGEA